MPQNDPLDGAIVSFINYGTGTALDLSEGSSRNETPIIGYKFHGHTNQQWRLQRVDSSTVWPTWKLINVASATVVDLYGGGSNNGNPIIGQVNQADNMNQLWYLVSADPLGRVVKIQNIRTGTYVNLLDGSVADGTKVTGYAGSVQDKNSHQLWRVLHIN
ncbi:hypothetical protein GQX73_g8968 [Xylaria multiplex]|uniref:Ricin B lectin domain-containing protein n=1 Tax=Xylaria multiplex TaxID=323545 RepID=A0A7C8MHB2_9PEZI|nr:hypothetical protein GQX73_g8968 [Xylaria multiplex]